MRCLPDFSPDTILKFNGIRVERTGCLDRWIVLPRERICKVSNMRTEDRKLQAICGAVETDF